MHLDARVSGCFHRDVAVNALVRPIGERGVTIIVKNEFSDFRLVSRLPSQSLYRHR
jgi:hypothetical protein